MINSKKELNEYLDYEKRFYDLHGAKSLGYAFVGSENYLIWKFQRRLRISEYHKNCNHKFRYIFSLRKLNKLRFKTGFYIGLNVFGKGLRIMHVGHIITNSKARFGENTTVHINTSFVAGGTSHDAPEFGDNCIIGIGATILGGVKIANGIAIGANAVVNHSFLEENISVAGVPARKISDNGSSAWDN